MAHALAGTRIREARRRRGLTQAALARAIGISASYLNLIEHNRRRIGGARLLALAAALEVRSADLADEDAPSLVSDLQAAAAQTPGLRLDLSSADGFAARYPDWAALTTTLARRGTDQAAAIAALSDRLTHDPFLAENVHAMLSHITAIRSAAGILQSMPDLAADKRAQFQEGLSEESVRLSTTAERLAEYLGAAAGPGATATAEEALDRFLDAYDHHFPTLDTAAAAGTARDPAIDALLAHPLLENRAARNLARRHLQTYVEDAARMPLEAVEEHGARTRFDPAALARAFGVDMLTAFRRLSTLHRPGQASPRFGLIVVTASGYPLLRRPIPGFPLPRHGNACPLWPLFQGFTRPGQPLIDTVIHDNGARFVTYTHAAPRTAPRFGAPQDLAAAMLISAAEDAGAGGTEVPVGTSCRICTRSDCVSRAEAPLIG
ncbi:MAG: short-chain fatty acyl-CoA regulator family protein [Pseudomonadota bacterium]